MSPARRASITPQAAIPRTGPGWCSTGLTSVILLSATEIGHVTEPRSQPDAKQPHEDGNDLEAQLDALLQQIEEQEPGALTNTPPASKPQAPAPATAEQRQDAAQNHLQAASPSADDDFSDDDLGRQIQSLLDNANAVGKGGAKTSTKIKPAPPASAPADQPADEQVPADDASAELDPADDDDSTIRKLDELLAEEAQDAVAGDFETVDHVLGDAAQPAPPPAPAPAPVPAAKAPQPAAIPKPPTPPAAPAQDDDDEGDDFIDGDFEDPAESLGVTGGSAADVAAELDDQPENRPAPVAAAAAPPEPVAAAEETSPRRSASRLPRLSPKLAERTLRHTCATLNRPLQHVSPGTRSTIGWVGLLTLGNGVVLLLFALVN